MPELPDLLHMQHYLRAHVVGQTITTAEVRQPIVLRNAIGDPPELILKAMTITGRARSTDRSSGSPSVPLLNSW